MNATVSVIRDRYEHLKAKQEWSVGTVPSITLRFAHEGFGWGGKKIEPNNFFFKHFLLPSKSGASVQAKAEARLQHRHAVDKGPVAKSKVGAAKNKAWAGKTPRYGEWPDLSNELNTTDPRILRQNDNVNTRIGQSWSIKYGSIDAKTNSAIVLTDIEGRSWSDIHNLVVPISPHLAADKIASALKGGLPSVIGNEPSHLKVTVDFGVACIITTGFKFISGDEFDFGVINYAAKSKMIIEAWACGNTLFDVYHCDGCL